MMQCGRMGGMVWWSGLSDCLGGHMGQQGESAWGGGLHDSLTGAVCRRRSSNCSLVLDLPGLCTTSARPMRRRRQHMRATQRWSATALNNRHAPSYCSNTGGGSGSSLRSKSITPSTHLMSQADTRASSRGLRGVLRLKSHIAAHGHRAVSEHERASQRRTGHHNCAESSARSL